MRNNRGLVLGLVVIMSIVFSTAAFAIMAVGLSRRSISVHTRDRVQARYAAEAGVVRAMSRLWADPAYCSETFSFEGYTVEIDVTSCGAGNDHEISAKVVY